MRTLISIACSLVFFLSSGNAQTMTLVKDINPGSGSGFEDDKEPLVSIGHVVFFAADDGIHGRELWRSDGTEAGTFMVKDIRPGADSSAPIRFDRLGDKIVFFADDGQHGTELWITDGTELGTTFVKDINPGLSSSVRRHLVGGWQGRIAHKGVLYFAADSEGEYSQLWRSDGTPEGTYLLAKVCPACLEFSGSVRYFAGIGEVIYFVSRGVFWRSDGTPLGTHTIFSATDDNAPTSVGSLGAANGKLYMGAALPSSSANRHLWESDGTKEGTKVIKYTETFFTPYAFTALDSKVFFLESSRLWSTDGTEDGTKVESDLIADHAAGSSNLLYAWRDAIYFKAKSNIDQPHYIYKIEGVPFAISQFNFQSPYGPWNTSTPISYANYGDYLFYDAVSESPYESSIGVVHYSGSPATIVRLPNGLNTQHLHVAGENLFFRGKTHDKGEELWKISLAASSVTEQGGNSLAPLKVYPTYSPEGRFFVEAPPGTPSLDLSVFDALGRQVHRVELMAPGALQISHLPPGTYWVRAPGFAVQAVFIGN